ncbi:membrane protein [Microbacterium phage Pumpernickel]|uniref:Membrane protein n=1 Tax=Microbacterium phage Pumpernickel TaxID=2885983 RepID=A0AAE9C300_9CAUD|nr:membrane protein [Microbacterium phage Pumpernickel]UDL16006.1 membrane protein [Microbacterium phage Pumpernickel]
MKRSTRLIAAAVVGASAIAALAGCSSAADTADYNTVQAAENFEVQRTIIGQSGITGEITFFAEGRCSFEYPSGNRVDVMCKYGPDEYRKHVFILGDQDRVIITQEESIDVSEYHTRIILRPQTVIPEFDIEVGEEE